MELISLRARFLWLFYVKVSYIIRTSSSSEDSSAYQFLPARRASPPLATCLTTQQSQRLWVGLVFSRTEWMGHGLSNRPSILDPAVGFRLLRGRSTDHIWRCLRLSVRLSHLMFLSHIKSAFFLANQAYLMMQNFNTKSDSPENVRAQRRVRAFKTALSLHPC